MRQRYHHRGRGLRHRGRAASCDSDCTISGCGDGTFNLSAGEQCDTAGYSPTCDANCTTRVCGDGDVNVVAGETCDDGTSNGRGNGFCLANCSAVQACGDNVTNETEARDDGNVTSGDGCSSPCSIE